MDFIAVKGTDFTVNGSPIALKGMGVGSWLNLEHFMVGMPGTDSQIRQAFEVSTGVFQQTHRFLEHVNFYGQLSKIPLNSRLRGKSPQHSATSGFAISPSVSLPVCFSSWLVRILRPACLILHI